MGDLSLTQPQFDGNGTLHVLLAAVESAHNAPLYYASLVAGDSWRATKLATYRQRATEADLAVEINGTVHVAWLLAESSDMSIYYSQKTENGSWSEPQTLVSGIDPREWYEGPFLQLAVDSAGLPHLAWSDKSPDEIFYIQRQAGGNWSQILNISNTPLASWAPELLLDTTGIVHVLWSDTREGLDAHILYANSAASTAGSSHIRQTVSLPAAPSASTLSFLYQFPGTESASGKRFELRIENGPTSTVLFTTDRIANDWTHRWFDMTPWAGHTVTLDFVVDQPAGQPCSWVQLDEVSLGGFYSVGRTLYLPLLLK